MKLTQLRRTAPTVRRFRHGRPDGRFASALALPITGLTLALVLVLVASILPTGAAFAAATTVVPITVPTLVVGWAAAVGLAFAASMVVVRGVVALLERYQ